VLKCHRRLRRHRRRRECRLFLSAYPIRLLVFSLRTQSGRRITGHERRLSAGIAIT
jgi:hypothetical protein